MALNSEDYAIVIGIEAYPSLPRLNGATKDATEFAEWLKDLEGGALPEDHVVLILSPEKMPNSLQVPMPIQYQIDNALEIFNIYGRERIGRRLYFYFSGHGYGQEEDDVGMFMAPASENRSNINIGLRPYKNFFSKWGFFDEVVFILDCCRNPRYYGETQKPTFTFNPPFPDPAPTVENFAVLATAHGTASFSAYDDAIGRKRGILTQAILEGLRDQLAADGKGRITASSLKDYISQRVPLIAQQNNIEQDAQVFPPTKKEIIFKDEILKMQTLTLLVPFGVHSIIIKNDNLVKLGKYSVGVDGNWHFEYLVSDPELKQIVRPIDGHIQSAEGTKIKVEFIQNGWFALDPSVGAERVLNLIEVDAHDANYIFQI